MFISFLFWSFEFRAFEFVSDFEIRHSDLHHKYFQISPPRVLPEASRSAGRDSLLKKDSV
jgi:hypothetical protein